MEHKAHESEATLEQQLQAMGLDAPRVTPAMIDSLIEGVEYHNLSDTHIVCKIVMLGGRFHVTGESSTVSKENFRQDIGENVSYRNARDKIWPIAGALLANDLHNFRFPLTEEQLKLDVGVQRVILEAKEVTMRVDGLTAVLDNSAIRAQLDPEELELLTTQRGAYEELQGILHKRLARIGL